MEMATGKTPWSGQVLDPMSAVLKIACSDEKPHFPTHFSEEGLDFLSKCLERNPDRRWTAEQLLDHPFISDKLQVKVAHSPASVFDIGQVEEGYDSDEAESYQEDDYRGRNPFSTRHFEEWKRTEKAKRARGRECKL